jgi:hypothetical protein
MHLSWHLPPSQFISLQKPEPPPSMIYPCMHAFNLMFNDAVLAHGIYLWWSSISFSQKQIQLKMVLRRKIYMYGASSTILISILASSGMHVCQTNRHKNLTHHWSICHVIKTNSLHSNEQGTLVFCVFNHSPRITPNIYCYQWKVFFNTNPMILVFVQYNHDFVAHIFWSKFVFRCAFALFIEMDRGSTAQASLT